MVEGRVGMKVYTKKGDTGNTDLGSDTRILKSDHRIQLLGLLDEANSHIGWVKSQLKDDILQKEFHHIQEQLMKCMSSITNPSYSSWHIHQKEIQNVEEAIDFYTDQLPALQKFIIPGENPLSAQIHVLRTVIRRCEVAMVEVSQQMQLHDLWKAYVNRLADYFFTVARYVEIYVQIEEKVRINLEKIENQGIEKKSMGLQDAKRLLAMVEKKAKQMGLNIVMAMVDSHGNPIAVHVMDGALIASYDIALKKAYTAVALRMSTEELATLAAPHGPLYGIQETNQEKIVIFGGGVLLMENGQILGGLGISGGTAEEDIILANYGAENIGH